MTTKESVRYIGKIREVERNGRNGIFLSRSILIDNPEPEDQYNQGVLIWVDNKNNESYLVKSVDLAGVSNTARDKGFTQSLKIDLGNTYHVKKI